MATKKVSTAVPPRHLTTAPKVRVRMYRQGLGDCFLITLDPGRRERHILIDCGSLGAKTTGVTLAQVVADIRATTGDHLDLLVATHEHKDHLSGFNGQREAFRKIAVDHVWLAWTENPDDPLAKAIAKRKDDLEAALVHACKAMVAMVAPTSDAALRELGLAVHDVLGFSGDPDAPLAADFAETINEAMSFVRTDLTATPRYCKPGDGPFQEDWLPGFRIYVLGPPRSEAALGDTGDGLNPDLYGLAAGLAAGAAPGLNLPGAGGDPVSGPAADAFAAAQPFDGRFRLAADSLPVRQRVARTYLQDADAWRRVDSDWLQVASDLALQLDASTNNTSLALAIERVADGKVLLFPADAQQGSWSSWHDAAMHWTIVDRAVPRVVRATDLLSKTVFYKVGHHASHNGTARIAGLELMNQTHELTAFIPVDRAVALGRNPAGSWRMPAVKLYRRLLEKCEGRVLRSDVGWADDAAHAGDPAVERELAGLATEAEWNQWRQSQKKATHVRIDKLFVDFVLE